MDWTLRVITLLPLADWLALGWFFTCWIGYVSFARRRASVEGSLIATSNQFRNRWMTQTTLRENRMIDGVVLQNLSTSPSFFASTTIFIIGGLIAALGATEKTSELVRELPFAARTSALIFDLKLLLLVGIFVNAFFRFTWSMRQYSFAALLIAAAPDHHTYQQQPALSESFSRHAGRIVALAAETFNDGLRAVYLSFAAMLWFMSPLAFALGSAGVIYILYQREFRSDILAILKDAAREPT
ncbi:protein of unknown function DUF599 [Leptothrix cholodnii SP-6]|uniref:DUF599 domain-containing protein n=1 Tax=Leptothrix cholodnii (strain ATCC 51168 / LMG 8142 / SP-6) TaxID=395495 RepID=B1Y0I1_LEPCP|nr:DUF599 domain-containing protein [Leptothrix cholodnii]ACB32962.1 protein of unknown function DUF599 [Leptothrix cholodnii SP-6]